MHTCISAMEDKPENVVDTSCTKQVQLATQNQVDCAVRLMLILWSIEFALILFLFGFCFYGDRFLK